MTANVSCAVADRVVERRRAVALARHFERRRVCRSRRSPVCSGARRRRSRRTSTTRPVRRHGRSRPATRGCAAAAAPTRRRATARATPTRIARRAIRARSSGAGPPRGCSTRCATGAPVTGGCPPPTTGPEPTRAGAGERHSSDSPEESGHQRAWLRRCSEHGPPPARRRCVKRRRPRRDRLDAIPAVCRFASRRRSARD